MKILVIFLASFSLISLSLASASLEKVDVKVLEPSKGNCVVTINPTKPKSVNIDVESFTEAKDITVRNLFALFTSTT